MSLQGSIETFAVADVLRLLAATSKTGRLHVQGPARAGTVWVETSRIVAAESPSTPYATGPADVVWQLLRFERGSFRFEPDRHPTVADVPVDIEFALGEAEAMLHEWRELEHRIPSGDIWVQLRGRLVGSSVTLAADEWATVAIISGGRTVHDIGESLRLGELQTAKAVARLLDLGLVEFGERPAPPVEAARAAAATVVAVPEVSIAAGADLWTAPAVAGNQDESWLPPDVSDAPAPAAAPPTPPAPPAPPVSSAPPVPSVSGPLLAAAPPAAPPAPAYDYPSGEDVATDDFSYPPAPPAPPVAAPDAGAAAYPAVPPPMPPVYGGATAAPGADAAWASSVGAAIGADGGTSIAPPPPPPPAPGVVSTSPTEAVDPNAADRLAPPPPPPPAPAAVGTSGDDAAGDEDAGEAGAEPDLEQQLYNLSPRAREAVKQSSGLFDGRSRR